MPIYLSGQFVEQATKRKIYGRVRISGEEIAEWGREAAVWRNRRAMQAIALHQRLGLNETQVRRVMRRLPRHPSTFARALRAEMAQMSADIVASGRLAHEAYAQRPRWWQIWRWFRG